MSAPGEPTKPAPTISGGNSAVLPAQVLLRTERLYLRRFTPDDVGLLFELDSDPAVMRFITKGQPTPRSQIENEILPRVLGYYRLSPPQGCWAAHLFENDEFVGWFHLRRDKISPADMELGYRLKRPVWGRGLATEGSRALVRAGIVDWGYDRISARTLVGNLASQRVMQKAGLRFDSEFTYSAEMIPGWTEEERRAVKYALLSEEWKKTAP